MTNKFSTYTENELKAMVDNLTDEDLKCTISELKELQSELINRRSDPGQISAVSKLIMKQIALGGNSAIQTNAPAPVEEIKPIEPMPINLQPLNRNSTARIDNLRPQTVSKAATESDNGASKFPILKFLILFYKIIGWFGVVSIVAAFSLYALFGSPDTTTILCYSGVSLIASALVLLLFCALSESVAWKLEVEKHLDRLTSDKNDK